MVKGIRHISGNHGNTRADERSEQPTTHRDVADMPAEDLRQLLHELQIRQTKLEAQNEKLRRAGRRATNFLQPDS